MVQLPGSVNLIQLEADVKTPEDDLALNYLAHQFPTEYAQEEVKKATSSEKASETKKKETDKKSDIVEYSKLVASQAAEYNQAQIDEEKAKEEAHHYDDLPEEAMVQLSDSKGGIVDSQLLQTLSQAGLTKEQL